MCISSAKVYWNEMSLLNTAYVQHTSIQVIQVQAYLYYDVHVHAYIYETQPTSINRAIIDTKSYYFQPRIVTTFVQGKVKYCCYIPY